MKYNLFMSDGDDQQRNIYDWKSKNAFRDFD